QGSTNAYLTTTSFSLSGTCSSVTSKDIDEDGFDDIFVSNTSYAAPPNSNSGQVNIYKGKSTWSGTNSPNTQITGTNNGYKFGSKVSLMDINNDNILDLIVSEPYAVSGAAAGVGRVLIFHNSSSKDFSGISYSSPNLTIQGESAGSNFGSYLLY
ncbi:MAG: VCBS repeat-containing protein, partial [Leptospiraceae bacterium]|nr:VCBS repeat-containing protein [Leptospiraceae bacterium]